MDSKSCGKRKLSNDQDITNCDEKDISETSTTSSCTCGNSGKVAGLDSSDRQKLSTEKETSS